MDMDTWGQIVATVVLLWFMIGTTLLFRHILKD
jgi:hypothetical protein